MGSRSLDLRISLNGLPVISLELKNPLTGQSEVYQ
jgi:type I site-specific restriction-modification system R (restriction) subunit